MRKFTLLFAFLLSLIGVAQAQTVITDLNSLSNGKVYTLTGERGTLLTFDGATMLYGTFAGDKQGVAYDASDPYQQFAILKSEMGDLYLYNVGLKKFINQGNNCYSLSTYPSHKFEATNARNQDGDYDWLVKVNGQMINLSGSDGGHNTGVNVGYSTEDPGNRFAITEVGTLDDAVKAEVEALINWKATTLPTLSTDAEPVYYSIKNLRSNKYAAHQYTGSRLVQTADEANAGALWYFVDASSSVPEGTTLGEGVLPVYIKNMATGMRIKSADAATYGDDARIWYLIPHTATHTGYVITAGTEVSNWTSWNDAGSTVCHYLGNDAGSIWAFVPTLSAVVNTAKDGVPALITNELSAVQKSAIAEAEALGARPYYSYSTDDVNTCKNTIINGIAVTTYAEFLTAKTTIAEALTTLKACTTINPIAGSEYVKIRNYNASSCYMKVKTTETTNEETSEVTTTRTVFDETSVGEESIWTFLAKSDNTGFYLYNPLTALYVKHTGGGNVALVSSQDEASVYSITPEKNYVKIHVGTGNRDYLHHQQDGNVVCWSSDAASSWWYIEKPTDAEIEALNTLLTPLGTLKTEAINAANARVNEIEASDDDLDFYTYDAGKITELRDIISNMINGATTHAELTEVQVQLNDLFDAFVIDEGNRTNPLTAGVKVKFRNKAVAENYMTVDADGATTSATVTSASIWTLVAGESDAYYLYNPLNNTYLKHATANGGQAAMVSDKAEASLYQVTPSGKHVLIGLAANDPYAAETDRDYVHCNDPEVYVTRFTEDSDRSLWTVTKVSDDDATALETEIQTILTERYNAAYAEVNNMVEGFRVLDFYRPEAAIAAYDEAVKNLTAPTTFDELDAAIATLLAAKTAFEAAVNEAVTNGTLSPVITNGVQVKLLNRGYSTRYMSSTDNKTVSAIEEQTSETIWQFVENDEKTGFYLFNPLMNLYVKHPTGGGTTAATLVADRAEASLYTVTPEDFLVKLAAEGYSGTEEYLNLNGWQGNFNVVRWEANGVANNAASYWVLKNVTEAELTQLASDIQTNITTQLNAALAAANEVVAPYKPLEFYRPTQAIDAYEAVIATITGVDTYDKLAQALAAVALAKANFEDAIAADDVVLENPVSDGEQIKLRNRLHSEYWMSAIDGKVGMKSAADASSIWTLKAAADGGFYLLNPLTNKYVKHIDQRDTKFELVEGTEEASVYYVHPNGLYVTVGRLAEQSKDEGNREYLHGVNWNADGQWVVRWNAVAEASQWGIFKTTEAEKTQLPADIVAYVKATITAAQEEALQNANAADDFAYYACSAENVAIAVAAINKVSTEITTHEQLSQGLAAINAALKTLYDSERTAGPAAGDRIRFINRIYTTHYLGYNSTGLAHYEPNTADDATENLPSTTIWQLEKSEKEGEFYLKNYLLGLYACFEKYNSDSQIVLRQEKNHPVKLIQKETIDGMLYFDIETQNTEVNGLYKSVHATDNGFTVQGNPDNYGSHWMITRATDEDLNSVNLTAQLSALIDFILKPVIEEAKRYYYVDAEGKVVNNFVDDVKAGYYTYTGDGTWDNYKGFYVDDINRCISVSENVDRTNSDQVYAAADLLRANIAKFSLNLPRTNGFFRLKCVYNDQYLQADDKRKTLALNEETGKASIFYFEAKGNGDDANTSLGTLVSYDQGLYFTQGSNSSGIYAKLQPIGTAGDTFSFTIPANNTFGSYNISSASGDHKRYLYGNAVERTELQVIDGDSVEVKYYRADNGDNATAAIQGDANNNGYNWVMERVDAIPVTISAAGWATFYAPIAMGIPEGVKAYICTGMDSNYELTLVRLSEVIPAGTAVLLEGTAGTYLFIDKEFEVTAENQSTENNCLRGVLAKTWRDPSRQNLNQDMTFEEGSNINIDYPVESGKVYTLGVEDGKVAMYRYAGNQFRHFCSYLDLPTESTAGFDVLRFGKIEEPTAIEEAPVVSLENVIIYDLSGRRVAEPGKGVYIVNGKKVYFK